MVTGAVDNNAILQGISQTLVQLTAWMDQLGAQTDQASGPARTGRHGQNHVPSPAESRDSSKSLSAGARGSDRKRKRRSGQQGSHHSTRSREVSDASLTSGESSSDEDAAHADGNYWAAGALVPGLPAWLHKWRVGGGSASGEVWGNRAPSGLPPLRYSDRDEPPGIHLSCKLRNRVLDSFYVDLFSLVIPEDEPANTDSKGRKTSQGITVDRSSSNWLKGYTVYMSVILATYSERGWHLANHLGNVLRAQSLAGDAPAMQYDCEFRKLVSHNELARWDLLHGKIWVVKVGPYMKQAVDQEKRKAHLRRDPTQRVCWEFNQGKCFCPHCKFEHLCEACLGAHAKLACRRGAATQQSFRGSRPSGTSGGKGGGVLSPPACKAQGVQNRPEGSPAPRWEVAHTPVQVGVLAHLLQGYPDRRAASYLVEGFRVGFRIPYVGSHVLTDCANLKSAHDLPEVVFKKLAKECEAGRVLAPFWLCQYLIYWFLRWGWFLKKPVANTS